MSATNGQLQLFGPFLNLLVNPPVPYANVRLYTYQAGTNIPATVYTDPSLLIPATNPIQGDARGMAYFYANASLRVVIRSSVTDGDLLLYDWDGVEVWHPDAALRSENRGPSYPAAINANRGQIFAKTDGSGNLTEVGINKNGSSFAPITFQNDPLTATQSLAKGADIASASTLTLGSDGNFFHVTGTTGITAISAKPAGTFIALAFDGALSLTHNATSLILADATEYTTAAGDTLYFVSEGSGNWREVPRRPKLTNLTLTTPTLFSPAIQTGVSGTAVADQAAMEAATDNTKIVVVGNAHHHPGMAKAWVNFAGSTGAVNGQHNVTSVTRNNTGDYTINFAITFSGTNYVWAGGCVQQGAGANSQGFLSEQARTNATLRLRSALGGDNAVASAFYDPTSCSVVVYGDL